jgi:glycosyltransferase involved in cell wall biosynthesis
MSYTAISTRIAVVIPCFNDGCWLRSALSSIREREPVEVVVVDDGSTDPETLSLLDELRSEGRRVVRHDRNRGLAAARNTGLAETGARFVFPLDADDLAVPGALAVMADRLDAHPAAAVCYGDYQEFGDRSLVRPVAPDLDPYIAAYTNKWPVSALFARRALDAAGGWRDAGGYEDWDLWMSLAERQEQGLYAGRGFITFRYQVRGNRMLSRARAQHSALYRTLQGRHPRLFSELSQHRRRSTLPLLMKVLYPLLFFGGVPRLASLRDNVRRLAQ